MNQSGTYPKNELRLRLHRYCLDPERGLPIKLFAEACGYSETHFRDVFQRQTQPLTDIFQIRASRVLQQWERGEIKLMRRRSTGEQWIEFREEGKARLAPVLALSMQQGRLTLQARVINRSDYSASEPVDYAFARLPLSRTRPVRGV